MIRPGTPLEIKDRHKVHYQRTTWNVSAPFTPAELDVVRLLDEGLTNKEIAEAKNWTVGSAKTYVGRVFTKLEVRGTPGSRCKLRMLAVKKHLESIPPPKCEGCVFRGFAVWAHEVSRQLLERKEVAL